MVIGYLSDNWTEQVREGQIGYVQHDQLFKQLIEEFFEEFLEAFFPEIHKQINFETITFLSEELFTDTFQGNKRVLDLAVEVKLKETDALIAVHIEPQSYKQTDFHKRMFKYFSMLYNRLERPIIPIAVFSYKEPWEISNFKIEFPSVKVLDFNYLTLHLQKQNWRQYIKNDNPVASAMMSKMGYTEDERVQVKLEFIKTLARLKLDMEKSHLLLGFFEAYLTLNKEEEEKFMDEARKLDNAEEVFEFTISYEEKGKEIGKELGKELGKKEVALNLLHEGFSIEKVAELTGLDEEEIRKLIP